MHLVSEASYENIFESDQSQLFDALREDKVVYTVPSAGRVVNPRLGILEWLSENLGGQNSDKIARLPNNWIRIEPRTIEAQFK
jgi:hypothetical protein